MLAAMVAGAQAQVLEQQEVLCSPLIRGSLLITNLPFTATGETQDRVATKTESIPVWVGQALGGLKYC